MSALEIKREPPHAADDLPGYHQQDFSEFVSDDEGKALREFAKLVDDKSFVQDPQSSFIKQSKSLVRRSHKDREFILRRFNQFRDNYPGVHIDLHMTADPAFQRYMQLAEKTRSFAKPEEWRALHATLAELSATNRVSSATITELSNGYTYSEAISLEDAAMSACMTTAADESLRKKVRDATGDTDDKIEYVLKYLGTHGGAMKSGESSRAEQLTKYHKFHNRSVDGETISVDFGYDTLARVLAGGCN